MFFKTKNINCDETINRIAELERKVQQLECSHGKVKFVEYYHGLQLYKECSRCGKVLDVFLNHNEFKLAQARHHEKQAKRLRKQVKV